MRARPSRFLSFGFWFRTLSAVAALFAVVLAGISAEEKQTRANEDWDQQISCRPGQAVSDITWTEDAKHFRHYFISCRNYTDSCNETCEWTVSCSTSYYGQGVYVRGLQAIYDNVHNIQRVLFLCCNSSKSMARRCDRKMTTLTGKPMGKRENVSRSFRQAKAVDVKDGHGVSLLVETCSNSWSNITICPLPQMLSKSRIDLRLAGLAGLAGLTGLAGLALVMKQPSRDQKGPCCCDGQASVNTLCDGGCESCTPSETLCVDFQCVIIGLPPAKYTRTLTLP